MPRFILIVEFKVEPDVPSGLFGRMSGVEQPDGDIGLHLQRD